MRYCIMGDTTAASEIDETDSAKSTTACDSALEMDQPIGKLIQPS